MELLISANGEINDYSIIKKKIATPDIVIGADGGAVHLKKLGLTPMVIVGDLDSIPGDTKKYFQERDVPFKKHPPEKDFSDTELATTIAIAQNPSQITYIGVTGKRLDHTFANISLLLKPLQLGIPARIIDEHNEIRLMDKSLTLEGAPGDLVSIIPVTEEVKGVTLQGLKYPLESKTIKFGSSLGISNVMLKTSAEITMESGLLMVIKSKD